MGKIPNLIFRKIYGLKFHARTKTTWLLGCVMTAIVTANAKKDRAHLDSLLQQLPTAKDDTNKVRLLYSVAQEYYQLHNDSCNIYAGMGRQLAVQLDDKYGQGMCLMITGAGMFGYNGVMGDLMEALKLFEQIDDKAHIAMVLDQIAGHYYNMERYPEALNYFERELELWKTLKDEN